jgi:hypothetical protein
VCTSCGCLQPPQILHPGSQVPAASLTPIEKLHPLSYPTSAAGGGSRQHATGRISSLPSYLGPSCIFSTHPDWRGRASTCGKVRIGDGNCVLELHASKLMPGSRRCSDGHAVDQQARAAPMRTATTGGGRDRLGRVGALLALVFSSSKGITAAHVTEHAMVGSGLLGRRPVRSWARGPGDIGSSRGTNKSIGRPFRK